MRNEIDDRINCRVGELKQRILALVEADPGKPSESVVIRRLLSIALDAEEKRLKKNGKEVA
jgi:hypothetical protein